MLDKKYSNILTVILVIAIVIILAVIGKIAFDFFRNKRINDNAEEAIANFDKSIEDADRSKNIDINGIESSQIELDLTNFTYGGYNMMGYIEIPAINIKYPVLETVTTHSIEIAVAIRAGVGLNGVFFSDLGKLKIGDDVYITDRSGTKIKYDIYNIYSAIPEDASFNDRDTEGRREITLSTCDDSAAMRTIIYAKEEEKGENSEVLKPQDINLNNTVNNATNNTIDNNMSSNTTNNNQQ